eukprot:GHVN01052324.1.p1 GENE.GHVN01052324.1~~GHVN01052324.1.p1  ORF type:complete len:383 (+),score=43.60 GHVN01052324.1:2-1150(+)
MMVNNGVFWLSLAFTGVLGAQVPQIRVSEGLPQYKRVGLLRNGIPELFDTVFEENQNKEILSRETRSSGEPLFSDVDKLLLSKRFEKGREEERERIIKEFGFRQTEEIVVGRRAKSIPRSTAENGVEELTDRVIIRTRNRRIRLMVYNGKSWLIFEGGEKVEIDTLGKLIVVIGDDNVVRIQENGIRMRVSGNQNRINVDGSSNIVFVEGSDNKLKFQQENNVGIFGEDAIDGRLYVYAPRNDLFISGDGNKICILNENNFVLLSPSGSQNRTYFDGAENTLELNASQSKVVANGDRTKINIGVMGTESRVHVISSENTIVISGFKNDVEVGSFSDRNNILLTKISYENDVCVAGTDNTVTDNGTKNDIMGSSNRGNEFIQA